MLTREAIRTMTSDATYKRGLQLYYSKNRMQDFQVEETRLRHSSTLSGNTAGGAGRRANNRIFCKVRDAGTDVYQVKAEYDPQTDKLVTASCNCLAFVNSKELCKHCVAVLLKYGDWQIRQGLYVRPEGNFEKVDESKPKGDDGNNKVDDKAANPAAAAETVENTGRPEPPMIQAYVPKEATSWDMKALLGRETRKRTAPVTEPLVHGRVRIEPVLHLSPLGDKVEFRVGAERMYVVKDTREFVRLMEASEEFRYGKGLAFTHSMEAITPECRPLARFILDWTARQPADTGAAAGNAGVGAVSAAAGSVAAGSGSAGSGPVGSGRFIRLTAQGLEELLNLVWDNGLAISLDGYGNYWGRGASEKFWHSDFGWPEHILQLRGDMERGSIAGLEGITEDLLIRAGSTWLYAFQTGFMYRRPRQDAAAIGDWLVSLSPSGKPKRFYIDKLDIPVFCRELLPEMKRVFTLERQDFDEDEFEMARAAFHFYLDMPEKDVVTCRALASYGPREYALYKGLQADIAKGLADRDLVAELSLWQMLGEWLPAESGTAGVSERILAGDEEKLYSLMTDGITALQNLGTVYVSDALRRISVRPAPAVNLGVSLSGDLLNLTVDAEGLSREELADILARYDRRRKFTRLKNGDFLRMDGEEIQALADMQEGMGFSAKELKSEEPLELPRYRALFLDKQMREGALDGIPIERSRDFKALVRNMRTVEDSDYEVPASLKDIMRSYQKQGFRWLKTLSASGFGGILADDMGLGKTLQVISFLLSEHEERTASAVSNGAEEGRNNGITPKRKEPTLIVCPASLVYNWESEIRKFAPVLEPRLIVGSAPERKILLDQVKADCESGEGTDVVCVTSYELLRRDIEFYDGIRFGVQVIDEAQYIKNHDTKAAKTVKQIRSSFKVALTGTPIENRLSELWSIFDYMMPGFLYGYEQFRKRLERPIVALGSEEAMERLHRMIGPFILRRLKKDVLRDLPDKIEENMMTRMEDEQRQVYDAQVQVLKELLQGQTDEEFAREQIAVLSMLTRLRQLCCDPGLVYQDYTGGAAKVDLAMELVENAMDGGHKMLVFSQFTSLLAVLENRLKEAGIACYKLEGSTPKKQRMEMVEAFNKEDNQVPVFLISLKAGGTGLNLTAADVVIHFDPWWNQAAQNQATDRAHRIGQKQVVNVYKLIARDTIEENIIRLQERKRQLADQVLGGSQLGGASFSREELLEILG